MAQNDNGLKLRYLINRHSSSFGQTIAVEGDWLARSGFALPSPLPRGQRASELTAKLANYERTDKISSVGRSFVRPALLSVRCSAAVGAGQFMKRQKSSPNLFLFPRTQLN